MRLLVIRNSALGDVAMVRPCIIAMQAKFPGVEIDLLTKPQFRELFDDLDNVQFIDADYEGKHKGATGLLKLAKFIHQNYDINQVVDLHDVVRSKIIRTYFKTKGIPVHVIDKNRKAKKELVKGKSKRALLHAILQYAAVFKEAGFDLSDHLSNPTLKKNSTLPKGFELTEPTLLRIGIAPFAKHALKIWPIQQMMGLMKLISEKYPSHFYLLGGREDVTALQPMAAAFSNSTIIAGKYSLAEELAIIGELNFTISMDSANMHLAALMNTRVFSIWGATDPLAGFSAWNQPTSQIISIPNTELTCRPCTIFGKGECYRKDFACMNLLTAEKVFAELSQKGAFVKVRTS
jgi:ADP-heptose:LPS heptosyltransferase